jgi:hypothetical protein
MIQNGQGYFFGGWQKAVREFLWENNRLQRWGPKEYVAEVNETDMRLTFTSGTFVKLDGADKFAVSKGFNPDFIVLDEFADYPEEFWHAMSPNFASKDCIVIIISSPPWELEKAPDDPVLFVRLADLWKENMERGEETKTWNKYAYVNLPTHVNEANLPPGFLEEERKTLIALGLEDIWQREYLARRVVGGGKRLVGTFSAERHKKDHRWMLDRIAKDAHHMTWITACDPGSSSVFGALIIAINEYTKEVYFFDEVYETQENETMVELLWPRIQAKEDQVYPGKDPERFLRVYDEAAKWFQVEVTNRFDVSFLPTDKATNSIEFGVSLLRTLFWLDLGYVSERCKHFIHELENWRKDKKGRTPDKGKHLVDCSRYGLHLATYFITPNDVPQKAKEHPAYAKRFHTVEEDQASEEVKSMFGNPLDEMADRMEEMCH